MLKAFFSLFSEAIYPTRCLGCNKPGLYFCPRCLTTVNLIDKQKCSVCEKKSPGGKTHFACLGRYTLDGLFSLYEYKGLIRQIITQLKFRGLRDINYELSRLVNYTFRKFYEINILVELEDFIVRDSPFITPVSLHWWRKNERKFNQAEFIANILSVEYNRPVMPDILIRTKNTQQQTKLRGELRKKNMENVFKVRDKYLTKRFNRGGIIVKNIDPNLENILLIDDVVTTGATLKSATKTLKRSGAKKVWAITLAS